METLLDLARNARLAVDSALVDIILQSADHMTRCLLTVETGAEPPSGAAPLVARIQEMIEGESNSQAGLAQLANVVAEPSRASVPIDVARSARQETAVGPRSVKVDTGKLDYLVEMVGELVIAQSLIQRQIRVNAVAPGPVWTPLNPADAGLTPENVAKFGQKNPMGRPAQPEARSPRYAPCRKPASAEAARRPSCRSRRGEGISPPYGMVRL